jgi:hypothetical protein
MSNSQTTLLEEPKQSPSTNGEKKRREQTMENSERIELIKQAMLKLYEAEKLLQEADPGDGHTSFAIDWLCRGINKVNESAGGSEPHDSLVNLLMDLGEDYDNIPHYHDIL